MGEEYLLQPFGTHFTLPMQTCCLIVSNQALHISQTYEEAQLPGDLSITVLPYAADPQNSTPETVIVYS